MTHRLLLAGVMLLGCVSAKPAPDVSFSLIEYRVVGPLGQLRLTAGVVHDPAVQARMLDSLASYDARGLVLLAGESARNVVRRDTIGAHIIETQIHVYPPVGRGFGGGLATASVTITVDGTKRVDCPYVGAGTTLDDIAILPSDGMITVSGSQQDKHFSGVVFMTSNAVLDVARIQRMAR